MPIGNNAEYQDAEIQPPTSGVFIDEDIIILTPDENLTEVYENFADWHTELNRCVKEGGLITSLPIPATFFVSPPDWNGTTPNHACAVLLPGGRFLHQSQPFSRCSEEYATTHYVSETVDLYSEGITGAHGGSGLSSIGGTIRVGELKRGQTIRHALKLMLSAEDYYYFGNDGTKGYRWPAIRADIYANEKYQGINPEFEMGVLLALKPNFNVNQLTTEPAKIIARALKDYGGYITDDAAWDVISMATEWGPNGRVKKEFKEEWDYSLITQDKSSSWYKDMATICEQLHIVTNNTENSIGGGGEPRQDLAPVFNDSFADDQFEAGKQFCIDHPEECGIDTSGEYTQADIDAKYKEGRQNCIHNPEECGLYAKSDLNNKYDEGYEDGVASVDFSECVQDYTQSDLDDKYDEGYDEGYAADGKDDCPVNEDCEYTKADIDAEYQEGYDKGCSDCSNGTGQPSTLSSDLKIHIPKILVITVLGEGV